MRKTGVLRPGRRSLRDEWKQNERGLRVETCSLRAVWEEEVYFKPAAISPEQSAAGQFPSHMNNAPELPSSPFPATADACPSFETWGGRGGGQSHVCHLNDGAVSPKRGVRRAPAAARGVSTVAVTSSQTHPRVTQTLWKTAYEKQHWGVFFSLRLFFFLVRNT